MIGVCCNAWEVGFMDSPELQFHLEVKKRKTTRRTRCEAINNTEYSLSGSDLFPDTHPGSDYPL